MLQNQLNQHILSVCYAPAMREKEDGRDVNRKAMEKTNVYDRLQSPRCFHRSEV